MKQRIYVDGFKEQALAKVLGRSEVSGNSAAFYSVGQRRSTVAAV